MAQAINYLGAINAGRYNVSNPGGSQTWQPGGPNGAPPTLKTTLNPTLTKAQGTQDTTFGRAVANSSRQLGNPTLNFNKIAPMTVNPGMTGQNAIMARLQPQIEQERNALHTQLTNWGLQPGTEAYDQAMKTQSQRENDLMTQAALQGISLDTSAHQQGIADQQAAISTPLAAINTMGGNTSSNMTFQNGQGNNDALQALIAQGNQNTANQNQSRQSTADWLNFAGKTFNALPDGSVGKAYDWLSNLIP